MYDPRQDRAELRLGQTVHSLCVALEAVHVCLGIVRGDGERRRQAEWHEVLGYGVELERYVARLTVCLSSKGQKEALESSISRLIK